MDNITCQHNNNGLTCIDCKRLAENSATQTYPVAITEERKSWHNLEAQISKGKLCTECGHYTMYEHMATDRDNDDVYYFMQCTNCGHSEA